MMVLVSMGPIVIVAGVSSTVTVWLAVAEVPAPVETVAVTV
jgi:hypothetical protein